jgi:S-sulfo-L-cysteine synthase (O-acetyl-L-serine-dependent)
MRSVLHTLLQPADAAGESTLGTRPLERVGETPLLRLERIAREVPGLTLLAKAEWLNPGGSVKDRAAARIVAEGRRSGSFASGKRLLDATSGNTGIAYAMLGAAQGFGVTLCVPANASPERKRVLRAFGAEVVWTDAGEGSDGAIRQARAMAAAEPERWFYADQYSNEANWRAHYEGTAEEIWAQTRGRLTHFAAVLGTSGTFVGTSRRLKELARGIRCVSLQPDSPFHGIEGAKHMASALVPAIYDRSVADLDLGVSTEAAHEMARRLALEEGLLVGVSAAAAVAGSLEVARRHGAPAVVVTVLPDAADKYLSERFWEG